MERLLGAHMPAAGGLHKALYAGKEIGCTAVQVFTASPRQWKHNPLKQETIDAFEKGKLETGIQVVVSHAAYLINLAAPDEDVRRQSYDAYLNELQRCALLGIPYAVVHMGAHLDRGEEAGLKTLIESLRSLLQEMPDGVKIAMETMAGQGSALCYKFEHFARVLEALPDDRLVICADSCHLFAAGYDLRTPETYQAVWQEFDRLIGIPRLQAWHLNDSKKPLGSRVDRHDHIGAGEIGAGAFKLLMNDPRFASLPMLLETPDVELFAEDLARLRGYIEE
jgi:deoxyribonuclease-4